MDTSLSEIEKEKNPPIIEKFWNEQKEKFFKVRKNLKLLKKTLGHDDEDSGSDMFSDSDSVSHGNNPLKGILRPQPGVLMPETPGKPSPDTWDPAGAAPTETPGKPSPKREGSMVGSLLGKAKSLWINGGFAPQSSN